MRDKITFFSVFLFGIFCVCLNWSDAIWNSLPCTCIFALNVKHFHHFLCCFCAPSRVAATKLCGKECCFLGFPQLIISLDGCIDWFLSEKTFYLYLFFCRIFVMYVLLLLIQIAFFFFFSFEKWNLHVFSQCLCQPCGWERDDDDLFLFEAAWHF